MTRKPPRHATGPASEETPVVLPHAVITITEAGALGVTLDGIDVPQQEGDAWTRSTFGTLLDALTRDRTITVRIEVHESDGTVFTDIIRARRRTTPEPPDTEDADGRGTRVKASSKRRPDLVEVTGEEFVPGEDIAVAVIISHTDATSTGHARALLDRGHLRTLPSDGASEVVLFGRVSGTIHVRRLS